MAKIIVEEQKDFTLLPVDSILNLKVDEVEIREVPGRNGTWEKVEIKFKVLGIQAVGDGSPVEGYEDVIAGPIWGSVPFRLTDSPENKLRQWAEAILGMDLGLGYELDTDHFLSRECRGITSQYDKKSKDPKTGLPFKSHQIDALLRKAEWNSGAQVQPPVQDPWATQPPPQQQYAQPQQQYAQPQQQYAQPPAQDPWATPGVQQAPPQQPYQPQPVAAPGQPIYQQPQAPAQDPWATPGGNDEPPF